MGNLKRLAASTLGPTAQSTVWAVAAAVAVCWAGPAGRALAQPQTPPVVNPDAVTEGTPGDRVEVINTAAQLHRANLGLLRTWQGTFVVTDKLTLRGQPRLRSAFHVTYAVDTVAGSLRWNRRTTEAVGFEDGREVAGELKVENGMKVGDDFYRYGPCLPGDGQIISVNAPSYMRPAPVSTDFSPLYFFTDHGQALDDRLKYFYENSGRPGWHWKTSRAGDRLTIESVIPNSVNRTVVNLATGGNLVESYQLTKSPDGKVIQQESKMVIEHKKIAEIWVPSRVTYYNDDKPHDTRAERTIEWQDQAVNEPLPADAFTLAAVGARPGDEVVDMRSGTRALVPGLPKQARPTTPPASTAAAPPAGRPWLLWLGVTNLCVGGGAGAVWAFRRFRSRADAATPDDPPPAA